MNLGLAARREPFGTQGGEDAPYLVPLMTSASMQLVSLSAPTLADQPSNLQPEAAQCGRSSRRRRRSLSLADGSSSKRSPDPAAPGR